MSINVNSCPDNETKSLVCHSSHSQIEILSTTIQLLNEQIDSNCLAMEKLVTKLHRLGVEATYRDNRNHPTEIECEHNLDPTINKKADTIRKLYNTYYYKNCSISENISQLKNTFVIQMTNNEIDGLMTDFEQSGIMILKAQETERNRIAADLHDSIIQNMANLIHKSELCIHQVDTDPISVKLDLQLMMQNIKTIIDDIRSIIYNLRPMAFDDLGLEVAIKRFLEQFEVNHKIKVKFINTSNHLQLLNSVASLTLFRIIQEGCSNAVKHGQATLIDVSISDGVDTIELLVKDNGHGFNTKDQSVNVRTDNSGFGLSIMKERIFLLSGSIMIDSKKNIGTTIHIKVPIITC